MLRGWDSLLPGQLCAARRIMTGAILAREDPVQSGECQRQRTSDIRILVRLGAYEYEVLDLDRHLCVYHGDRSCLDLAGRPVCTHRPIRSR